MLTCFAGIPIYRDADEATKSEGCSWIPECTIGYNTNMQSAAINGERIADMDACAKTWNFDEMAERYDEMTASSSTYYARYDDVLDAVVEVAMVSPGKRVLDLGVGTGNLAIRCLDLGAEVVGLDPSEAMLAKAREKVGRNRAVELARVEEPFPRIPYPGSSFDAVVSTYAFHHVPHASKPGSVREMVRVIRPGGIWVMGDLMFEDEEAERSALREYEWLEEEYFARIEDLRLRFGELGMELRSRQFTPVTWVVWAAKP